MINLIRESICFLLYTWHIIWHRLPQVSSVYFHDPSPKLFETVLKWYVKHNYRFISLAELKLLMENKSNPKERLAFISFDDGWQSNLKLIPLCEQYNVPITIFVATEPLMAGNYWWEYVTQKYGRQTMLSFKKKPENEFYADLAKVKSDMKLERSSMTIDELKSIAANPLVTIQSHTVNHPILTNISEETLEKELSESKQTLQELVGYPVDVFSYPNGNVGQREIEALKKTGYRFAFTTQALPFDVGNLNPYLLPRMAMNVHGGKYDNLAKLTGVWYKLFPVR